MIRCHECESEIAENDLFCPYCGISVPRPSEVPSIDDEMASTIMMPMPSSSSRSVEENPSADLSDEAAHVSDQPGFADRSSELSSSDLVAPPPIPVDFAPVDEHKASPSSHEGLDETPGQRPPAASLVDSEAPTPYPIEQTAAPSIGESQPPDFEATAGRSSSTSGSAARRCP